MTGPHLFNIPSSATFAKTLAEGLIARVEKQAFALSDCVIYLPTRRAARNFGEAFAGVLGGAALLPEFRALGESDEEELGFDDALTLPPAISPIRRQLLLANLVQRWVQGRDGTMNFAQATALADSLAKVMDEIEREGADLSDLKALAPVALAEHWEQVTRFLDVIHQRWPAILAAEGTLNRAARTNQTLALLAKNLAANPPAGMVIAAGSTGSVPATARLLEVIAGLERGAVVLPGLDVALDDESWDRLDPGHSQFGLKSLLMRFEADRARVAIWHESSSNPQRESLLREALRPAPTTDVWRTIAEGGAGEIAAGLDGLTAIAANDPAQEALVIALALRETLETENRAAALVTPDRNLARRVAGELGRWGIAIDDSAGRPLAHTSVGAFLCLLAEAAEAQFAPVPLLALLKHPFATLGEEPAAFRAHARDLDRLCLRGPRPDPSLGGIARAIAQCDKQQPALSAWWDGVAAILSPLEALFALPDTPLDTLIDCHVAVAERLACKEPDPCPLWRDADGEAAALLVADFAQSARGLPAIEPHFYPALLRTLAMAVPVRPHAGRRRAIAILGPLEARLQTFDLTILGGLNEGGWPAAANPDPWFSRPMREQLGLQQPERAIGLAAHDFSMLAAGREVLLTRALKSDGTPTIPSRWLQRMTQLCGGLQWDDAALKEKLWPENTTYLNWARQLADVPLTTRIRRPAPTPPLDARPRKLSVTEIEKWLRDPYAIYARHVLGLRPLHELDEEIGPLERGNALHKALELFVERHPGPLPDDALAKLMAIAEEVFAAEEIPKAQLALWRPRFWGAAKFFLDWERPRRSGITRSYMEVKGRMTFDAPGGPFTLSGVADRIDALQGGGAAILDYKTGSLPHKDWIAEYLAPQLLLEGAMLSKDGFGIGAMTAGQLIYLRLSGGTKGGEDKVLDPDVSITEAQAKLEARVKWFDEGAPYHSRVAPQSAQIAGDYDHLARVREWAPSGWSEER